MRLSVRSGSLEHKHSFTYIRFSYMLWLEVFVNMEFRALYPDELEVWLDHVTDVFFWGSPIFF